MRVECNKEGLKHWKATALRNGALVDGLNWEASTFYFSRCGFNQCLVWNQSKGHTSLSLAALQGSPVDSPSSFDCRSGERRRRTSSRWRDDANITGGNKRPKGTYLSLSSGPLDRFLNIIKSEKKKLKQLTSSSARERKKANKQNKTTTTHCSLFHFWNGLPRFLLCSKLKAFHINVQSQMSVTLLSLVESLVWYYNFQFSYTELRKYLKKKK